jgi:hypothetical protein
MCAQEIAAGQVRYAVFRRYAPCLGAFAGSDRTKQDKIEGAGDPSDPISAQ